MKHKKLLFYSFILFPIIAFSQRKKVDSINLSAFIDLTHYNSWNVITTSKGASFFIDFRDKKRNWFEACLGVSLLNSNVFKVYDVDFTPILYPRPNGSSSRPYFIQSHSLDFTIPFFLRFRIIHNENISLKWSLGIASSYRFLNTTKTYSYQVETWNTPFVRGPNYSSYHRLNNEFFYLNALFPLASIDAVFFEKSSFQCVSRFIFSGAKNRFLMNVGLGIQKRFKH